MFFNGLIRKLGTVDVSQYHDEFIKTMMESAGDYSSTISVFNNSNWALMERSFKKPELATCYIKPGPAYYALRDHVLDIAGKNYYVVASQVAWLNPGQHVDPHVDLQKLYALTRRIHIQIERPEHASMSMYNPDEVLFHEMPGSVYELNNRVAHSAKNNSPAGRYIILIFDIATHDQSFVEQDNIEKILESNTSSLPILCE